jgi:hypothetical protein
MQQAIHELHMFQQQLAQLSEQVSRLVSSLEQVIQMMEVPASKPAGAMPSAPAGTAAAASAWARTGTQSDYGSRYLGVVEHSGASPGVAVQPASSFAASPGWRQSEHLPYGRRP